jgi:hypothetical protein
MKKQTMILFAAAMLTLCGCGTTGNTTLDSILNGAANGQAIGNVIQSVLGLTKVTQQDLIGTWKYQQPGCAFTSEKLLAQAGGEIVAADIKTRLLPYYEKVNINSSNTQLTLKNDGTFTAIVGGKSFSGSYTYDEGSSKIVLKGMLLTINCYAKRNANGMAFLFEASKLITLLQAMSALTGNAQLQGIADLAKNYDGLRVGFDMKK